MIVVNMGRNRCYGPCRDFRNLGAERGNTCAGIDEKVAVSARHMPDIAADEGMDMRLVKERHTIANGLSLEPALGNLHSTHSP
jgi:hypothetical protein